MKKLCLFVLVCVLMFSSFASAEFIKVSQGLNSAQYTASMTYSSSFVAANAFDGGSATQWVSGGVGPQWIEVDLGQEQTLSKFVGLATSQSSVIHEVYLSDTPIGDTGRSSATLVYTFSGATVSGDVIEQVFAPTSARYAQVFTPSSTGWVGWKETQFFVPEPGSLFILLNAVLGAFVYGRRHK